jgi:hypothetical protein
VFGREGFEVDLVWGVGVREGRCEVGVVASITLCHSRNNGLVATTYYCKQRGIKMFRKFVIWYCDYFNHSRGTYGPQNWFYNKKTRAIRSQ